MIKQQWAGTKNILRPIIQFELMSDLAWSTFLQPVFVLTEHDQQVSLRA